MTVTDPAAAFARPHPLGALATRLIQTTGYAMSLLNSYDDDDGAADMTDFWSGIINPDWQTGPVFTDEQLASLRDSPEMAALGLGDLTEPLPQFPLTAGLPNYPASLQGGPLPMTDTTAAGPAAVEAGAPDVAADSSVPSSSQALLDRAPFSADQIQPQLQADLQNIPMPELPASGTEDSGADEPNWPARYTDYHPPQSALTDRMTNIARTPLPNLAGALQRTTPGGNFTVIDGHNFPTDATFAPDAATALTAAIQEMNAQGIHPKITDGFRTAAQQEYEREHPGKYTVAKVSWHQTAKALDMDQYQKDFPAIVAIMKKHGFSWGGDFKTPDRVHFLYGKIGPAPSPEMLHAYGGD